MEPDQLFTLRNSFWLGNYQAAIHEGSNLIADTDAIRLEKDVYVFRSYIALNTYGIVLDEINEVSNPPAILRAIKLLVRVSTTPSDAEAVAADLTILLNDAVAEQTELLKVVAATVFTKCHDTKNALKVLHNPTGLEMSALSIQLYLKMNRLDLAVKECAKMQEIDDDATLSQLASAWVNIAKGGTHFQEAAYAYETLMSKFDRTSPLLNGLATCNLQLKQYKAAYELLSECSNVESDPVTLVNLITCAQLLKKTSEVQKYLDMLQACDPQNSFLMERTAQMAAFDKAAREFTVQA